MKTWKPTAAGILSVITGALSISIGILRIVIQVESPGYEQTHTFGVVCIILGLIAVVGGIFAIRRPGFGVWR
jgi:membrane-bound ClpP family serine protease